MAGSYLRQSTASQSRATPPFLDDTDFKTAETALTIANTDVKLIVNGGASADKNSGGGTHRANGVYGLTFDATDTATVGELEVSIKVAGALPVFCKFWVLEEAVYDALFAASAAGYGTSTLDAAGVRTAIGLASANLDTQLSTIDDFLDTEVAAIKAKTDLIPATPASTGDQMALTSAAIDLILDDAIEGSLTLRQALRIILAAAAGKLSGAATTSVAIRDQADTKNRIAATVDADGNRSAVTVDGT